MIPGGTIIAWMIFLNLGTLGLFSLCLKMLPESSSKKSFLLFIVGYLAWINPLLGVQLLSMGPLMDFVARLILAGACLFIGSCGHFIIEFSNPETLKTKIYKILQGNNILMFILIFAGYMDQGVELTEKGLAPIPGVLEGYFYMSVNVFVVYFLTISGLAYRRIECKLLKAQLRTIFWTVSPSFAIALITNAIIPGLTGNWQLTPTGGLWLLFFFVGITYILICGRAILVKESFKEFLNSSSIDTENNMQSIRKLIDCLSLVGSKNPDMFSRELVFSNSSGSLVKTKIARENFPLTKAEGTKKALPVTGKNKHLLAAIENAFSIQNRLQLENQNLMNQLSAPKRDASTDAGNANQKHLPVLIEHVEDSDCLLELEQYSDRLKENCNSNIEKFGIPLLSFSLKSNKILQRIESLANSSKCVVIGGETGTGKTLLAHGIHNLRGGGQLKEIYCDSKNGTEVLRLTREFFSSRGLGSTQGLLLKHFDKCQAIDEQFFEQLFQDKIILTDLLYLTVSPGYLELIAALPKSILSRIYKNVVWLSPLRDSREDIFYLTLWFIDSFATKLGKSIKYVDKKALEKVVNFSWRGNVRELRQSVEHAVVMAEDETIQDFDLEAAVGQFVDHKIEISETMRQAI